MSDVDIPPEARSSGATAIIRLTVTTVAIALAVAYLVSGVRTNLLVTGPALTNAVGDQVGSDFTAFYTATREALAGRSHVAYDPVALRAAHAEVVGGTVQDFRWTYPPTAFLLFAPLATLPPIPALWLWMGLTVAWLAVAIWHAVRWWPAPLLVLIFPAVVHALRTGPTGTLSAALLATIVATLDRRPAVAGLALAALAYKPHLAALLPICLACGGHWRALGTAASALLVLGGSTLLVFGSAPWTAFVAHLPDHFAIVAESRMPWARMPTVFVAVLHATADVRLAGIFQAAATTMAVAGCAFVWRRTRAPGPRWLALAAGLVLASPYAFDYDEAALVIPFMLLAASASEREAATSVLVLLWLTPVAFLTLSQAVNQQIGPLPLFALLGWAVTRAQRATGHTPRPRDTSASTDGSRVPQGATGGSHK